MNAPEQNDPSSHIANVQAQLESLQSSLEAAVQQIARLNELLNMENVELPSGNDESSSTLIQPPAPSPSPRREVEEEEDYSRRIDNNEVLKGVDERLRGLAG